MKSDTKSSKPDRFDPKAQDEIDTRPLEPLTRKESPTETQDRTDGSRAAGRGSAAGCSSVRAGHRRTDPDGPAREMTRIRVPLRGGLTITPILPRRVGASRSRVVKLRARTSEPAR